MRFVQAIEEDMGFALHMRAYRQLVETLSRDMIEPTIDAGPS